MTNIQNDEFPDYASEDYPEIPANWLNMSWHNDAMPFFVVPEKHLGVWMDYKDPAMRENGIEWPRFAVEALTKDDCHTESMTAVFVTEDFAEVLAFVEAFNV